MFTFLLVVHVIIAVALVGVILMQRSEGGGLTGGSPAGLMSARGAGDFLTRMTTILATLFILLSIALAAVATLNRKPDTIDTSLARPASETSGAPADANSSAPAAPVDSSPVPLAVPSATTAAPAAVKKAVPTKSAPVVAPAVKVAPTVPAKSTDTAAPAPANSN
jgi:preprotein translocase subunit SecG